MCLSIAEMENICSSSDEEKKYENVLYRCFNCHLEKLRTVRIGFGELCIR